MKRFINSALSLLASMSMTHGPAFAQTPSEAQLLAADLPVPFYTPSDFIQGLYRHGFPDRGAEFAQQAQSQVSALNQLCSAKAADRTSALKEARAQWQMTAMAWDRLSAVAIGPLLKRRSQRQIDFTPTRPELIKRAILSEPADALAMERIGTPAKGFPALEWLLWTRPDPGTLPNTPACHYAQQVALEIQTEATALGRDFETLAAPAIFADREVVTVAMNEMVNQWIGGLERLRWTQMEKPLMRALSAKTDALRPPDFPRSASGSAVQSWAAQWKGIAWITLAPETPPPLPGEGALSLEIYLRGRGMQALANKLVVLARKVEVTLPSTASAAGLPEKTEILAATKALAELKRFAETEMAAALDVNIGFSDADGD